LGEIFLGNKFHAPWFSLYVVLRRELPPETFEELAMPLFDRLYNFACWLTQDRGEAEDLVQETYAKALKAFSSYQTGTNFRAWMYRILRNTFLTSRAGMKQSVPLEDEDGEDVVAVVEQTPESDLLRRTDIDLIHRALDMLPVNYREALLLCEIEEMSYRDIAATIGIPIGTVMSRLSRARRALREAVIKLQGV
jgi:RNA polymerase sigma-70 factor (ECF subfamily)